MPKEVKKRVIKKNAKDGRIVSNEYFKTHSKTTYALRVPVGR